MKKNQTKKERSTHIFKGSNLLVFTSLSLALTMVCATPSISYGAIYKCNLPDGSIAYSNDKKLSKNCVVTNLNASSNFSVIDTPSVAVLNKEANYYASNSTSNTNSSNKNFPKLSDGNSANSGNLTLNVSEATQTRRDETRNSILQKELDAEQKSLDDNKAELATTVQSLGKSLGNNKNDSLNEQSSDKIAKLQQSIEMHKNNIMALNKELKKPDITVKDTKTDTQRTNDENSKLASISTSNQDNKENQDLSKISSLEKQINDNKLDPKQIQDAIAIKNSINNSNVSNNTTTNTTSSINNTNNTNVVNKIKEISKEISPNINTTIKTNNSNNPNNNKDLIKNFISK